MSGQADECPGVLKQERATIEQVLERTSDIYRASECSEEQALGAEHPSTLISVTCLGMLYIELGPA